MPRRSEQPAAPADSYEGDDQLGINEQCTGDLDTTRAATKNVNDLLRSGKLDGISEFSQGWIDIEHAENPNAFLVHWDPNRLYDDVGAIDWGHNDIWNRAGIYVHCAPSVRTAARVIFHEIAHDYPINRSEWFRSEGWNDSGTVQMSAPLRNRSAIQSDVHLNIQSAVNRAMVIYDQNYSH
jgi:hypothetical protein